MLVVSDTSPITSLLQIGQAGILRAIFGRVLIPSAVENELLRSHSSLPDFLDVQTIQDWQTAEVLCRQLDRGEAEAIVLAEESHADYLLIDEKLGRSVAEARGLSVVGLLGVLLLAKNAGLVSSVAPLVADLETQAGFFVSARVKQFLLAEAGES